MGIYQFPPFIMPSGLVKVSTLQVDGSAAVAGAIDFAGNTSFGDATGDTIAIFGHSTTSIHATIIDCTVKVATASGVTTTINSILDVLIGYGMSQATA